MIEKICIIHPFRTPVTGLNGSLSSLSASNIGAVALAASLTESDQNADVKNIIEEVYLGNVLQAGAGQNPARQAAIKAGLSYDIPASTINTVCGSGMHAIIMAVNSIRTAEINAAVCGGMESMTQAPFLLKNARNGYKLGNGELVDSLVADGLTCPYNHYHMGITAENIAERYHIGRQEQDEYAAESHKKANEARTKGIFKEEISPVVISGKKVDLVISEDEGIRPESTVEKLSNLKPVFKKDGTVTAGNASSINDGAATMVVLSESKCKELGTKPFAYIRGYSIVGLEPEIMGMGPVKAIHELLRKTGLNINDIDLFELNEAFAVQSIAVRKELGIHADRVNVNGGAIAIGHPVGASGARIVVSLLYEMRRRGVRYGIASLCIGSGMGIALLVELYQ